MSPPQKNFLERWAPHIIATLINVALLSFYFGKLDSRVTNVEEIAKAALPRAEATARANLRDSQLANIEKKLDLLLAHEMGDRVTLGSK